MIDIQQSNAGQGRISSDIKLGSCPDSGDLRVKQILFGIQYIKRGPDPKGGLFTDALKGQAGGANLLLGGLNLCFGDPDLRIGIANRLNDDAHLLLQFGFGRA